MTTNNTLKDPSMTQRLAHYVTTFKDEQLPMTVKRRASLAILDWLSSYYAGQQFQTIKGIIALQGRTDPTVIRNNQGPLKRQGMLNAAFLWGAQSHIAKLDDSCEGTLVHPGSVIMSSALACAAQKPTSGLSLLKGIVLGYDIALRIARAIFPYHYKDRYFHATSTCGIFGATAAAGSIFQLSCDELTGALAIAASFSSGLRKNLATEVTPLHVANGAYHGVLSALLALQGISGATHILEGRMGFFEAFSPIYDDQVLLQDLGEKFEIERSSFVLYPSCGATHAAIRGALSLAIKHQLKPEQIQRVELSCNSVTCDVADVKNPQTRAQAQFSVRYCVATALARKTFSLREMEDSLKDPTICCLMERIIIREDPAFQADTYGSGQGARVRIFCKDGQSLEEIHRTRPYFGINLTEEDLYHKVEKIFIEEQVPFPFHKVKKDILTIEEREDILGILEYL